MPFFRRKKQQPSLFTFHSSDQLSLHSSNPDHRRFSDARLSTDRPLHHRQQHRQQQHHHQPYQQPQQQPQHPIRRAQTQNLSLPDLDPRPSDSNNPANTTRTTANDSHGKLHKKKHAPSASQSFSSAKDLSGFLGRSLSIRTPQTRTTTATTSTTTNSNNNNNNNTTTTTTTRGTGHAVISQSIPEISMPDDVHPHPQPRTSISTAATSDSNLAKPQPSDQPHRPPSQQSFVSSLPSVSTTDIPTQTMAADRPGQGQSGRQSPYPPEVKTTSEGRSTPGPGQKRDEDDRSLATKHEELLAKYSKVKRYYFEKEAQVQHLQNTVAHQRMAVSRTVLDDNEYANRFGRLDGAIKDLAFSIRKDWKSLPPWLLGYVNDDAHTVGMKEMTAIGRAVMSHWLAEEIFQRHFHPALEPALSQQLKGIENNLRYQHVTKPVQTEDDKENAIAKISNWRRTTFDGLGDAILQGRAAEDNRAQLIEHLVAKLLASLELHLSNPPPVGMENSARMIVENAVGIAEKIPLESRDVWVEYPTPGSIVDESRMKIETGIPPLTKVKPENARKPLDQDNPAGQGSEPEPEPEPETNKDRESSPSSPSSAQFPAADAQRKKPTSVFTSLMGKRSPPTTTTATAPTAPAATKTPAPNKEQEEKAPGRIRFASFMHAEVRGKGPTNVLAKAPVYLLE